MQFDWKVVALAYRRLSKDEMDLVEQRIRVDLKVRRPLIKYYEDRRFPCRLVSSL